MKLNEEKAKLDREMSHIALDKKHLDESKVKLDHDIYDRTQIHETEKDGLVKERDIMRVGRVMDSEMHVVSISSKSLVLVDGA